LSGEAKLEGGPVSGYLLFLESMCCPFCGGSLGPASTDAVDFNILVCGCSRHPVVAGIPILKREAIGTAGTTVDDVCQLIEAGRHREALLSVIMPPSPSSPALAPAWVRSLPSIKGLRRLQRLIHTRAVERWQTETEQFLTGSWSDHAACEVLDLYYRRSGFAWNGAYEYFALRFGQPRHLVGLSLMTLIERPSGPILDLACGFGHLTHSLLARAAGQPVIGVDQTFIGLYVAKKFIAPAGNYICCTADGPLPFRGRSFSNIFCSDAFHYFLYKSASAREFKRILNDDGIITMVWMHNKSWPRPNDGLPLSPEGYSDLVSDMPYRMVADSQVLQRYLRKQGPPLACSTDRQGLADAPLLSLVASRRKDIFRDYGTFDDWPHALGRLRLNPLYRVEERGGDSVTLRRAFPSDAYLDEHAEAREYLPETVEIRSHTLEDLAEGRRTADVERLLARCVAVGMPDRYL
jgi:SAM-dependent methyltransferase